MTIRGELPGQQARAEPWFRRREEGDGTWGPEERHEPYYRGDYQRGSEEDTEEVKQGEGEK